MKKKVTALFAAMVMTLSCFILPAQAEETKYQLGDINMDGKVDCVDAMLALVNYTEMLALRPSRLTQEQTALGNVDGESYMYCLPNHDAALMEVDVCDAFIILENYARRLAGYHETVAETMAYLKNPDLVLPTLPQDVSGQLKEECDDAIWSLGDNPALEQGGK